MEPPWASRATLLEHKLCTDTNLRSLIWWEPEASNLIGKIVHTRQVLFNNKAFKKVTANLLFELLVCQVYFCLCCAIIALFAWIYSLQSVAIVENGLLAPTANRAARRSENQPLPTGWFSLYFCARHVTDLNISKMKLKMRARLELNLKSGTTKMGRER